VGIVRRPLSLCQLQHISKFSCHSCRWQMKQPRVPVNMEYCWYCQLLHAPLTHQLLLVSHLRCLSCRDALLTPPHSLLSLHSLHVGVSDSGGQVYQTLGDRAFPVAAARTWNSLPPAVRDAPSLLTFRSRLKTWLFELTLA